MREELILLGGEKCRSWTCVVCGEVTDAIIRANRAESLHRGDAGRVKEPSRTGRAAARQAL